VLEKLILEELVEKFPEFLYSKMFITVFTIACLLALSCAK